MITVSKDGKSDYAFVSEAVKNASAGDTIFIKNGIYHEQIEITVPDIALIGEDRNETVIEYDLYANMTLDGGKRGTFRSYTMLAFTHDFTCKNLTVQNSAGFGNKVGQAVAVYAEGDRIRFENCRILGHQDTLFTGPLPLKEVIPGGFAGPTEFAERKEVRQLYIGCYIEGEVDFIFGSAAALFDNCELFSLDRKEEINGYVCAPSTYRNQKYGYIFNNCRFTGNCPPRTVYLGRPWRNYAKSVLLNCEIGAHIRDEGFHDWNKPVARENALFALYDCRGDGYVPDKLAPFVKVLSKDEAKTYSAESYMKYYNEKR